LVNGHVSPKITYFKNYEVFLQFSIFLKEMIIG